MKKKRNIKYLFKTVKCSLNSILLNPSLSQNLIERRCLAVSQMTLKAYHVCRIMIDKLLALEKNVADKPNFSSTEIPWPDFNQQTVFYQLFCIGCN